MRRGAHAHDPISRIKSAKQIYRWINRAKIIVHRRAMLSVTELSLLLGARYFLCGHRSRQITTVIVTGILLWTLIVTSGHCTVHYFSNVCRLYQPLFCKQICRVFTIVEMVYRGVCFRLFQFSVWTKFFSQCAQASLAQLVTGLIETHDWHGKWTVRYFNQYMDMEIHTAVGHYVWGFSWQKLNKL